MLSSVRDLFGHAISPAQQSYLEKSETDGRLLKVSLQNLSEFPGAVPSDYFDISARAGSTLDLVFEYAQVPRGSFNWKPVFDHASPNSVLHLNTADNDHYQNGIPGVAASIEGAARWMERVRGALGKRTVRTMGASMGAYAALLYGDLVNADAMFGFSPTIQGEVVFLGSRLASRPIGEVLPRIRDRSVITYGAFDLCDYAPISHCLAAGLGVRDIAILGNVHGASSSVRLDRMITGAGPVAAAELLVNRHEAGLDGGLIERLGTLDRRIGRRQHDEVIEVLRPAAEADARNPEFHYRLAVHLMLAGRPDEAVAAAREAGSAREYHNALAGFEILGPESNFRRKLMHDYGALLGFAELKPIVELFT